MSRNYKAGRAIQRCFLGNGAFVSLFLSYPDITSRIIQNVASHHGFHASHVACRRKPSMKLGPRILEPLLGFGSLHSLDDTLPTYFHSPKPY